MNLKPILEVQLGKRIGQLRATPVRLGGKEPPAFLVVYAADFDLDPWIEMFFFPKDTLKMALISSKNGVIWKRDLGPGIVPGQWFCPFLAFDLDEDG
ncbi:MAG: polysaccharide lyase 11, partial [Thermoproteota archaeon]